MPSLSASAFGWLLLLLLVAFSAMALWAFYFWWKRDRHTRERFAFAGFFALLGFGAFFLGSLSINRSIIDGLLFALLKPFGFIPQSAPSSLTPLEAVLFAALFVGLIWAYVRVFAAWTGKKSRAQHEREQNRETASTPFHPILRSQRGEKRPDARRVSAGIATPIASSRNEADGRFSSRPKGAPKRAKARLHRSGDSCLPCLGAFGGALRV